MSQHTTLHATFAALLSEPRATDPLAADDDSARALWSIFVQADGVPQGPVRSSALAVY